MDEGAQILINWVIRWAIKKKRWPLLFLCAIPGVFSFIQKYFELSFRETVWHWSFLIASGVLCIVSGVLYWAIFRQGLRRPMLGGFLVFSGVAVLIGGVLEFIPPSLPEDRLVVAIAQFTPISSGAEEEADNVPHRIEQSLREKLRRGAPLKIKRLLKQVVARDEQARREVAIALGTSREGNAHVVLWGEVRKDEGELYVKPRLTVARQLGTACIEETRLGEFVNKEPKHLEFKERLSYKIADVVVLVYGLAYYKVGDWDRAIDILNHIESKVAYLYKGWSLYERGQRAVNPRQALQVAIRTFEKVIGPRPWHLTARVDSLAWIAYLNRANAVAALGLVSQPSESQSHLREAAETYRIALQVHTRAELPLDWAMIQNNLGFTLTQLGIRVKGEEGIRLLRQAVEAYRAALQVPTRAKLPQQWARTQHGLGIALTELGIRVKGEEGIRLLRQAVEAYRAVLQVRNRAKLPQQWAITQNDLGVALDSLGVRVGGEQGIRLLRQAVEAYRAALQVPTRAKRPQEWARTQNNLGAALVELGIWVNGEEGIRLLRQAVEACRAALQVRNRAKLPQQWARTQNNLGNALTQLGIRVKGEEGIRLLRQAVEVCRVALQVHTGAELPLDWAMIQDSLGIALACLGKRIGGEEGMRYLNEAIASFDNALSIYDSKSFPDRHSEILANKLKAIKFKESLDTSRR